MVNPPCVHEVRGDDSIEFFKQRIDELISAQYLSSNLNSKHGFKDTDFEGGDSEQAPGYWDFFKLLESTGDAILIDAGDYGHSDAAIDLMAYDICKLASDKIDIRATIQDDSELKLVICLLYTSPSPRDATLSRMPSSA